MRFIVRFTPDAEDDLLQLIDFLIEKDVSAAQRAERVIKRAVRLLEFSPFSCRKAGVDPLLRELVIPLGHAGYVALSRIEDARTVTVLAIRHQRESNYH
jgi:plasmid stabilization system protein ParE